MGWIRGRVGQLLTGQEGGKATVRVAGCLDGSPT